MELLTLHHSGRHGDVEPSGIDLPSGSVPGAASESPRTRVRGGGVGSCFWKIVATPDDFRSKGFLSALEGAEAAPKGQGRVPPTGACGAAATARPWPGWPAGRPLVFDGDLSNKKSTKSFL